MLSWINNVCKIIVILPASGYYFYLKSFRFLCTKKSSAHPHTRLMNYTNNKTVFSIFYVISHIGKYLSITLLDWKIWNKHTYNYPYKLFLKEPNVQKGFDDVLGKLLDQDFELITKLMKLCRGNIKLTYYSLDDILHTGNNTKLNALW